MECKANSCVDTSRELHMESPGLLGATRSLDGLRVVAGGTASWTQLELGLLLLRW